MPLSTPEPLIAEPPVFVDILPPNPEPPVDNSTNFTSTTECIEPQTVNSTENSTQPEIISADPSTLIPTPNVTETVMMPPIVGGDPSTWSPEKLQNASSNASTTTTMVIEKVTIIEEVVEEPPRVVENACKAAKAL